MVLGLSESLIVVPSGAICRRVIRMENDDVQETV